MKIQKDTLNENNITITIRKQFSSSNMLKLAALSPMAGSSMSAQRRRIRKAASASDSLASLVLMGPKPSTNNYSVSSSSTAFSARKKQSKHHHHHSTPSSLERIVTTASTPIIPAAPSMSSPKKSVNRTTHSGKRSSTSITSLSSLVLTPTADKQITGNDNDNTVDASFQTKNHKKKRQMSPRSKSKLDSLVTHQQTVGEEEERNFTNDNSSQQQVQKVAEPTIVKGSIVMVQPRTWPGINKQGGVGRVTAVNSSTPYDLDYSQQQHQQHKEEGESIDNIIDASTTTTYDVSYVLGGKEKNIEAEYISLHNTNQDASSRERQQRTLSTSTLEKNSEDMSKKTKSVKKWRRNTISSLMTSSAIAAMEVSPTKMKESKKDYNNKHSLNGRGKQLKQLKKVKEQHMTAAAAEEEEDSNPNNLKSPAFSLSSQFSDQEATLSHLDYLADSYPKLDTPMLKSYANEWSNKTQQQGSDQNSEEEEERNDDPSSSVVSTEEIESDLSSPRRGGRRQKQASRIKVSNLDMKGGMSPPSENKTLEREYGRLALKKQEIERKMEIYKSDAEKINPWGSTAVVSKDNYVDATDGLLFAQSSQGQSEEFDSHPHRYARVRNKEYPKAGEVPSRAEVEFGELVYQRNLTNRRMAQLKDEYPKRFKPKKKRRRRVVETITRVIHEESEDDGSSISDRHLLLEGGRNGPDYYDSPHRYKSRNPISKTAYSGPWSDGHRGGSSDYFRSRGHNVREDSIDRHESRKKIQPAKQAASSGSRKTKSRHTSMLEDLD